MKTPEHECSPPPHGPVRWDATVRGSGLGCLVTARTWFEARRLAALRLKRAPEDLDVVMRPAKKKRRK